VEDCDIDKETICRGALIDLVKEMLALDQVDRITPNDAATHAFITGQPRLSTDDQSTNNVTGTLM